MHTKHFCPNSKCLLDIAATVSSAKYFIQFRFILILDCSQAILYAPILHHSVTVWQVIKQGRKFKTFPDVPVLTCLFIIWSSLCLFTILRLIFVHKTSNFFHSLRYLLSISAKLSHRLPIFPCLCLFLGIKCFQIFPIAQFFLPSNIKPKSFTS